MVLLHSSNPPGRAARGGLARLTAAALALGALGVLPSGVVQQQPAAAAESMTGGMRGADGNGVIEQGDQMASDLGAGTCEVTPPKGRRLEAKLASPGTG